MLALSTMTIGCAVDGEEEADADLAVDPADDASTEAARRRRLGLYDVIPRPELPRDVLAQNGFDRDFFSARAGRDVNLTNPADFASHGAFSTGPIFRDGKQLPAAQVYTCERDAQGALGWSAGSAPEATLIPLGATPDQLARLLPYRADHFRFPGDAARGIPAGPTWRLAARLRREVAEEVGSRHLLTQFVGALDAAAPATPGNIPDLRVRSVGSIQVPDEATVPPPADRNVSNADYVLRLRTQGGLRPTGACTLGEQRRVPYSADYYFVGLVVDPSGAR